MPGFELVEGPPWPEIDNGRQRNPTAINCPGCGRFAKYVTTRHYYNGTWDCIATDVVCSRCGDQTIEHV